MEEYSYTIHERWKCIMEGPRAAKREELDQVIGLINSVFRTGAGMDPTMGEEFPLLLSQYNMDNMRIMLDNEMPVASVNYYPNTILVEGSAINVASIGAVCTHPDYRGKGLSTTLLEDVENKAGNEGVDLLLVSGSLNIYIKRGCVKVCDYYKSTIAPSERVDDSFEVIEYDKSMLQTMISIYSKESTRFYRNYNEFELFLQGATTPWGDYTYKTYLIKNESEVCAYIVLRVIKGEEVRGEVVEYAGCREAVLSSLQRIIQINSLSRCDVYSPAGDLLNTYCKKHNIKTELKNLDHTIKILNFVSLMNKLRNYFAQYVPSEIVNVLNFGTEAGKYTFSIGEERVEIGDLDMLTRIMLSSKRNILYEEILSGKPLLTKFFNSVFPLPFPYPGGLNYI
jgi:predicted acetyltransferase